MSGTTKPEYRTLNDGCYGDKSGLEKALGDGYQILYENYDDSEGYGHHGGEAVFLTADGKYIHASCGGCSCEGSGDWSICDSKEAALLNIPEYSRPDAI